MGRSGAVNDPLTLRFSNASLDAGKALVECLQKLLRFGEQNLRALGGLHRWCSGLEPRWTPARAAAQDASLALRLARFLRIALNLGRVLRATNYWGISLQDGHNSFILASTLPNPPVRCGTSNHASTTVQKLA